MFNKLAGAAQTLREKADIGKRVEASRQFAADKLEAGKAGATAKWEQHWPATERLLVEGLLTVAEEKLEDDKMLEGAFLKLYETLPLAARFILTRERFLEFTMSRREPILLKLKDFRAGRVVPVEAQLRLEPPDAKA